MRDDLSKSTSRRRLQPQRPTSKRLVEVEIAGKPVEVRLLQAEIMRANFSRRLPEGWKPVRSRRRDLGDARDAAGHATRP